MKYIINIVGQLWQRKNSVSEQECLKGDGLGKGRHFTGKEDMTYLLFL